MKKLVLHKITLLTVCCLLLLFLKVKGQVNLVLNPSFEEFSSCPTGEGEIVKANDWESFTGSADYFNTCGAFGVQVPNNSFGYQMPSSGNAYAGIITYYDNTFYREILGGKLINPLTISQKYYFSFNVVRGDENSLVGYSTNKMGIKFTKVNSFVLSPNNYSLTANNFSHFSDNNVITNTSSWTRILGSFIADSAYLYLMIGNFFDDAIITITNQSNGIYAYYYIDDVCVSTDSLYAANYVTNVKDNPTIDHTAEIYPNPATIFFFVNDFVTSNSKIFNAFGIEMHWQNDYNNELKMIKCDKWPNGVYFLQTNKKLKKIIINHSNN